MTDIYNPYSPAFVKRALNDSRLRLSKSRGQNYLIDRNIADKIVQMIPEGSVVFEVGSGLGSITLPISQRFKYYSMEIDSGVYRLLKDILPFAGDNLIHEDFLKFDMDSVPEENLFFVSNLPYSITGEAVRKFIDSPKFSSAIVMVQKEAAERMTSAPGGFNYGVFTVLCSYYMKISLLFDAGRNNFFPVPTVDSTVIRLDKIKRDIRQDLFNAFLRSAFQSRRKTVWNNLKGTGIEKSSLVSLGIDPGCRPEEISPGKWGELFLLQSVSQ